MDYNLPEILRKIRVNRNYSQEFVAERINVSLSSYARYEAGKVEIDFNSVLKLAHLYKMSIDNLISYENKNQVETEPFPKYLIPAKVSVVVELDGLEPTLEDWIERLRKINKAI